jgi:hypothetical protein
LIDYIGRHTGVWWTHKMRVPRTIAESAMYYGDHFMYLSLDTPTMWDRGHVSELVYSTLYAPQRASMAWHSALRHMPVYHPDVALIYLYPLSTDLMLRDEDRPGADRRTELYAYDLELDSVPEWSVARVPVHEWRDGRLCGGPDRT